MNPAIYYSMRIGQSKRFEKVAPLEQKVVLEQIEGEQKYHINVTSDAFIHLWVFMVFLFFLILLVIRNT